MGDVGVSGCTVLDIDYHGTYADRYIVGGGMVLGDA